MRNSFKKILLLVSLLLASALIAALATVGLSDIWESMKSAELIKNGYKDIPVSDAKINPDIDKDHPGIVQGNNGSLAGVYYPGEGDDRLKKDMEAKRSHYYAMILIAEFYDNGKEFDNFEKWLEANGGNEKVQKYKVEGYEYTEKERALIEQIENYHKEKNTLNTAINEYNSKYGQKGLYTQEEYEKKLAEEVCIEAEKALIVAKNEKVVSQIKSAHKQAFDEYDKANVIYENSRGTIDLRNNPGMDPLGADYLTAVHELFHGHMNQIYPYDRMESDKETAVYCIFTAEEHEGFATVMTYFYYKKKYEESPPQSKDDTAKVSIYEQYKATLSDKYKKYFEGFIKTVDSFTNGSQNSGKAPEEIANALTPKDIYAYLESEAEKRDRDACTIPEKTGGSIGNDDDRANGGDQKDDDEEMISNPPESEGEVFPPKDDGDNGNDGNDSTPSDDEVVSSGGEEEKEPDESSDSVDLSKIANKALDEFAVVGPTIPHSRVLWIFSGESAIDMGADLIQSFTSGKIKSGIDELGEGLNKVGDYLK